jgi:hypothetical protein
MARTRVSGIARNLVAIFLALAIALGSPAFAASPEVTVTIAVKQAVYSVSLYGATSDVEFTVQGSVAIHSDRSALVNLQLAAEGVPWPISFSPPSFAALGDYEFTATVTVPRQAAERAYTVTIYGNDTTSPNPIHTQTSFTVSVYRGPLALEAVLETPAPRAGQTALWSLWIKNMATFEVDYNPVFRSDAYFSLSPRIPATQIVAPGDQALVRLYVTASAAVPQGDYEWNVRVESATHSEISAALDVPFTVQPTVAPPPTSGPDFFAQYWIPISIGLFAAGALVVFSLTEVGYFAITFTLIAPLFTRLKRDKVLDNFTRGQIFGYIRANPGAHYSAIQQVLEIENGVLAYHLRVLLRENYLVSRNEGVFKRFYPRDYKIPKRRTLLTRLQVDILEEVTRSPGVTQRHLARTLGESKQVVSYNVGVLRDARMLSAERRGREVLLRPVAEGTDARTDEDASAIAAGQPSESNPL